ncbi:MAG: hypothetical protein ACLFM1_09440 [Bacteroidales bacterium]
MVKLLMQAFDFDYPSPLVMENKVHRASFILSEKGQQFTFVKSGIFKPGLPADNAYPKL